MIPNTHDVRHSPPAGVMGGEAALRPDRLPTNSHCRAILSPEIPRTAGRRMMSNPSRAAHPFQTVEAVSHHPAQTPGVAEVVRGGTRTLSDDLRFHAADVAEITGFPTGPNAAVPHRGKTAAILNVPCPGEDHPHD